MTFSGVSISSFVKKTILIQFNNFVVSYIQKMKLQKQSHAMIWDNLLDIIHLEGCIYKFFKWLRVLEKKGAKEKIITLMETSKNPEVREQALVAVQKILISDWQRIGKGS
jgi:hypothetical protein